jgi:hypothetical protein
MGDITVLDPLQMLVPACGQLKLRDLDVAALDPLSFGGISVGAVLLAVRYGEQGPHELDDLSHRRAHRPSRSSLRLLAWSGARRGSPRTAFPFEGVERDDGLSWGGWTGEGWIDTEVGLT